MNARALAGPRFAGLRMLAGAAVISLSPVFVKLVDVAPTTSAAYRTLFGGVFLTAWLLYRRERLWPRVGTRAVLVAAALFFALDLAFWHRSILYVGPGMATLLGNFQVFILAAAGALFLSEPLGWRQWLAMPLALGGLALIVGPDPGALTEATRLGVVFGLLTALAYAAYMLTLRKTQATPGGNAAADLAAICFVSAAMLAALAVLEGASLYPIAPVDVGWLSLYGLFSQSLGWLLIASAVAHLPAARVGLIMLAQPVLAFGWDSLIFARRFSAMELAGAAIALVAIWLGTRSATGSKRTGQSSPSSL